MTFDPTEHPDFLSLASDLRASHDSLIKTIERARASAHHCHESYSERKTKANKLARGLLDLIKTGTLVELPGEQLVIQLALNSLVNQSNFNPVIGSLKTKGRDAGLRITRQSLYMDALAFRFQLTKTKYVRLCMITDDTINEDTANSDYRKFKSDKRIKNLVSLNTTFLKVAYLYDERIANKIKTLSPQPNN